MAASNTITADGVDEPVAERCDYLRDLIFRPRYEEMSAAAAVALYLAAHLHHRLALLHLVASLAFTPRFLLPRFTL